MGGLDRTLPPEGVEVWGLCVDFQVVERCCFVTVVTVSFVVLAIVVGRVIVESAFVLGVAVVYLVVVVVLASVVARVV